MFPDRFNLGEKAEKQKLFVASALSPEKRREIFRDYFFTREDFGQEINEALEGLNRRDPAIFGLVRSKNPGIPQGELMDVYYEHVDVKGKERTKKYTVSNHNLNGKTEFLVSFPTDQQGLRALKKVLDPNNKELIQSLNERLEAISLQERFNKNIFFSPEENQIISDYQNSFDIDNLESSHRYFSQMLSLFSEGKFVDLSDSKHLVLLKNGDGIYEFNITNPKVRAYDNPFDVDTTPQIDLKNFEKAKQFLSDKNPWYKRVPDAVNSLNVNGLMNSLYHLGKSFYDPGAGNVSGDSAIAAEHFIAQVYHSLTGKEADGPAFADKLRELNKTPALKDTLDDFIHVYTAKGKVTPSSHRNSRIHASRYEGNNNVEYLKENWTTFYYQDLVKTTLSALMGEPKVFNDFDLYAKNSNLHVDENFAVIDPIKAAHHKRIEEYSTK